MLVYTKTVLKKVSFDAKLFQKELRKALKTLSEKEVEELKQWVLANFYTQGAPVLMA